MRYFDFRLRAIRNIINSVKGFIKTITGVNSVTLDNCVDDDSLMGIKIYGNSVQDGTPAPDSPVEIQSVGELVTDESDEHYGKYKIPIKARGKNLFDINSSSLLSGTIRGTLEKIDNGFKCLYNAVNLNSKRMSVYEKGDENFRGDRGFFAFAQTKAKI